LTEFIAELKRIVEAIRKGRAVNTYRDVLEFQRHLTQAVVEKSAIAARQRILAGQFDAWLKTGKLNAKLHSG